MDRLWTALVFVAVLGLRGAAARDKTNMPQAKQEEGQSNNATAMVTVVPDPSAGGRVDPEVLVGMYNRYIDASIGGDVPRIALDGAALASLTKWTNTSTEANGTDAKGEKVMGSSAGSANAEPDEATRTQMGAMPNATNASESTSIISASIIGIGLGDGYQVNGPKHNTSGEPAQHLGNMTRARIGPMPNTTNDVKRVQVAVDSSARYLTNATLGLMGSLPNASANALVALLNGSVHGQAGPLNASAGTHTADVDDPAYSEMWNGTLAAGTRTEGAPLKADPQMPTDSKDDRFGKAHFGAHNQSHPNELYAALLGARGSLSYPVQNMAVFVDIKAAAQRYRLAPGAEAQASANRSNDPDVVAMKEIASVVLDGPEETAVIMTEVVIRSVLPDGGNGTMMRDTELHKAIHGKFRDEGFMKKILEGDVSQTHARPEQGPCETCPQPISAICSLCWPVDFCRPFASKVDIPCPVEQF